MPLFIFRGLFLHLFRAPLSAKEANPYKITGASMNLKNCTIASFVLVLLAAVLSLSAQDVVKQNKHQGPPILGPHWAKGMHPARKGGGSPNMTFHGGTVLTTTTTQAIFWGSSWATNAGDKISGMDSWYEGFGGSNYAKTSDEYSGTNGQVGPTVSFGGHFVDTTRASGGGSTSAILAEVCKVIPNPATNGYYAVYTDLPRKGNYCAYHSWGSCGSTPLQFAFFWKLDGDAGCDPESAVSGESQGLAALANVSGHELSEARTDPRGAGWFDASGEENGDKCAWTFNVPYVTFSNGTKWKTQGEWSNQAYNTSTGYPNSSGQDGCLDGH
jgi:hypothetical protein